MGLPFQFRPARWRLVESLTAVAAIMALPRARGASADSDPRKAYPRMDAFRDKIDSVGFNHPLKFYDLTQALVRRGHGDADMQAVLGGNFHRLLAGTWQDSAAKKGENGK